MDQRLQSRRKIIPIKRFRRFRPNRDHQKSGPSRPPRELVVHWYNKIKEVDPDWVDIEQSIDLNDFHGSTFKTTGIADQRWPSTSVFLRDSFPENVIPFANSVTATQWRRAAQHAWDLPPDDPNKDFILSVCESGIVFTGLKVIIGKEIVTRNQFGMTKRKAYAIWKDFINSIDDND